jgi:hypothetical protein
VRDLKVGQCYYRLSGSDCEIALAHAVGRALIELQQLEFTIISYLDILANGAMDVNASFHLFASKTFGNLLHEMRKHEMLRNLADDMQRTKEKRDFFVHKFLFHRFAGDLLTAPSEYELLVREASDLGIMFAKARTNFLTLMLEQAPIVMFGAKMDIDTGELQIIESEFAKEHRNSTQ